MSNKTWSVVVDASIRKTLNKIPLADVEALHAVLLQLVLDPFQGDIQKLKGEKDAWRRRVGSYRLKYRVYKDKRIVFIYELKRRTSTTY